MRCSTCSKVVKPIVAIDIDGTLGDYHSHFLQFAERYLGLEETYEYADYDGSLSFREWFTTLFQVEDKVWYDIKLAYRQGAQKRSMPIFKPRAELEGFLYSITRYGGEIWITTTRPFLRLDGIDPDTREWLRRNKITYSGLLYDEDKYRVLAKNVDPDRVIAVLDDLPEQYDAAATAFGARVPILRRTPYNRAIERPLIANNLPEAHSVIMPRLADWEETHEG